MRKRKSAGMPFFEWFICLHACVLDEGGVDISDPDLVRDAYDEDRPWDVVAEEWVIEYGMYNSGE